MKNKFPKRTYQGLNEVWEDFRYIIKRRPIIKRAMRDLLSPAFRERLMLVVTEVNGCRYCRTYHASEALKEGITDTELAELLAGQIPTDAPEEEVPAMIYARYWAESGAQPGPEDVQELIDVYGEEKAAAIHVVLRMIRMGNLMGNMADYMLYRLTFGRAGV
ncbi:MAG: carboxymuconolactone decarboxylase family protein [Anaerolineales bacterium]|nr:MAG: carboxymuconolactone decarboxylase family protein [Anaerolineales bacterium]